MQIGEKIICEEGVQKQTLKGGILHAQRHMTTPIWFRTEEGKITRKPTIISIANTADAIYDLASDIIATNKFQSQTERVNVEQREEKHTHATQWREFCVMNFSEVSRPYFPLNIIIFPQLVNKKLSKVWDKRSRLFMVLSNFFVM